MQTLQVRREFTASRHLLWWGVIQGIAGFPNASGKHKFFPLVDNVKDGDLFFMKLCNHDEYTRANNVAGIFSINAPQALVGQVQEEFNKEFVALINQFDGDTRNTCGNNLHISIIARYHGMQGYYFNIFVSAPETVTHEMAALPFLEKTVPVPKKEYTINFLPFMKQATFDLSTPKLQQVLAEALQPIPRLPVLRYTGPHDTFWEPPESHLDEDGEYWGDIHEQAAAEKRMHLDLKRKRERSPSPIWGSNGKYTLAHPTDEFGPRTLYSTN
jgi:hypothetical protein